MSKAFYSIKVVNNSKSGVISEIWEENEKKKTIKK